MIGGTAGVLFAIFAFSAFLFQVLQAITTAVLALATVVLALSTLSLYLSTRTLAEIELKRDRRKNIGRRIELGDKIVHTAPSQIVEPLQVGGPPIDNELIIAWSIRDLRQLINYSEGQIDDEIFQLLTGKTIQIRQPANYRNLASPLQVKIIVG